MSRRTEQPNIFVDRAHERAVVDEVLESARNGMSGALVVYGEAGMGKSALLGYASDSSGLTIARISGIETESSFGFAALHRLLVPILHEVHRLPAPQRVALESAFGLVDGPPPDRFLVALAALTVLSAESRGSGLLCIIDDAQWIDVESLQTLAFVARRLNAEGIALLFGIRTYQEVPSDLAGIPALEITGLPRGAISEVLRAAAGRPVADQVAERIATETAGCPLAIWELGRASIVEQWDRIGSVMEPIALTLRLEEHFNEQMSALSPDAQLFLLAAAADISGDRDLVHATARLLGCGMDCAEEAERQRLILAGPRLSFRHPLIRSAVYANAEPDSRRKVHRTFATLISKTDQPDRWARHVVLGAAGPDSALAAEVEATAKMARARGGYAAEAALLIQAADLTESRSLKAVRRVHAAAAAIKAGADSQVTELLDQALPDLTDPTSIAESERLRGELGIRTLQRAGIAGQLLAAARLFLPLDPTRARDVLLDAFAAYSVSLHRTSGVDVAEIAEVARRTSPALSPPALEDHLLASTSRLIMDGPSAALEEYQRAATIMREGELSHDQIARYSLLGLILSLEFFDDATHRMWAERADRSARHSGDLFALMFGLYGLADADLRLGDISSANARYEEIADLSGAIGTRASLAHISVCAQAWAGDDEATRESARMFIEVLSASGTGVGDIQGNYALAVMHLAAGRYKEALRASQRAPEHTPLGSNWYQILPLAIEAAARSGEHALAVSLVHVLESRVVAVGGAWGLGLLARSRALLFPGAEAEELYETALTYFRQTAVTRDLAHAQLLYGEWLRRQSRRVDAREQLRAAYEFFTSIGAKGFAARAKAELLATGERVRARAPERSLDLTPQERHIALLAAQRLTNTEIAAQLFLSSSTVDYHLRKVFRKLGIASRRELERALSST